MTGRPIPEPTAEDVARFFSKVNKTESCWLWTGNCDVNGYGQIYLQGGVYPSHRVSLRIAGTLIPKGMCADHTCRVRACVNPAHLRIVTPGQNSRENNDSPFAVNSRKTHCKHGHEFTAENTYYYTPKQMTNFRGSVVPGFRGRNCIACMLRRREEAKQRRAQNVS